MPDAVLSTLALFLSLHVATLVERLGDERFEAREAASGALVRLLCLDQGVFWLPVVERAARHADPEVARRANLARDEFYNVGPSCGGRIPWLDMLPSGLPHRQQVLEHYLAVARAEVGPQPAPEWLDYRLATVYYVNDQLRAGVPRAQLVRLLDAMAANEQRFLLRR
jgi:hypothetical protein